MSVVFHAPKEGGRRAWSFGLPGRRAILTGPGGTGRTFSRRPRRRRRQRPQPRRSRSTASAAALSLAEPPGARSGSTSAASSGRTSHSQP